MVDEIIKDSFSRDKGKAVILCSGGLDSAVALLLSIRKYDKVYAIGFNYGQRNLIELNYAGSLCNKLGVNFDIIDISKAFGSLVESALLNRTDELFLPDDADEAEISPAYVPNRNSLFIGFAHAYAQKVGASTVVVGAIDTIGTSYPDCTREFMDSIESTLNIGSKSDIRVSTPLISVGKDKVFSVAAALGESELNLIVHNTISCYNGDLTENYWGVGCGKCPACSERWREYDRFTRSKWAGK